VNNSRQAYLYEAGRRVRAPTSDPSTDKVLAEEQKRVTFERDYSEALTLLDQAKTQIEMLVSTQQTEWDSQSIEQRCHTVNLFQELLKAYYAASTDIVLRYLPGNAFLDTYAKPVLCQEDFVIHFPHQTPTTLYLHHPFH